MSGPALGRAGRDGARLILGRAICIVLLTAVAASTWWPVYGGWEFAPAAGGAIVAGVSIGALGAAHRWNGFAVLGATVAAWLLLGVPLAVPAKAFGGVLPTGGGLLDLAVGTATGWRSLLTIELPVGAYQALLVPVFGLALVCAVLGTTIATRTTRPAAAVLFPAVVLVAGIVFGARAGFAPVLVGGAFAVGAVLWLVFVAPPSAVPRRARLVAVPVVAAAAVGAVLVAAILPPPDRLVARDLVQTPFDAGAYASPLSGLRGLHKAPVADETLLTVTGAAAGSRLTVARLDDYDGVVLDAGGSQPGGSVVGGASSSSASRGGPPEDGGLTGDLFQRVTGRLEGAGERGGASGEPTQLTVSIGGYTGVWVPVPDGATEIAFAGPDAATLQNSLFASARLSTVADLVPLQAGDRYAVSGAASAPFIEAAALGALGPGATATPATTAPDALTQRLAEWAPDSRQPGERLAGIVSALQSGYLSGDPGTDVFSRSGHGADRLEELLTVSPMLGDAEQYATAAALLARAAGFPSRVAVGFIVPPASAPTPIAVRGRDATAWVEVLTADEGWVAIDPTPEARPIPPSELEEGQTAVQPPQVLPADSRGVDEPAARTPLQESEDDAVPRDEASAELWRNIGLAGLSLLVVAVLLAPFATVLALKARRRARRRTRGSARSRAAGSWAELLDAARDRGSAPPVNSTRREAAAAIAAPGAPLLAERVDSALYAPDEPTAAELEALWVASDEERSRLLHGQRRLARLRSRVSLRSLRAYHGNDGKRRNDR